jgi:hypothetical protein
MVWDLAVDPIMATSGIVTMSVSVTVMGATLTTWAGSAANLKFEAFGICIQAATAGTIASIIRDIIAMR